MKQRIKNCNHYADRKTEVTQERKNNNCNNRQQQNIIQTKKNNEKVLDIYQTDNVTSKKGKYLYQSESKKKSK
jgi:hypothetical protein